MAIIFGGDCGIRENSYSGFVNEIVETFNNTVDTVKNALEGQGPPQPPKENVHVDTGFSNVPGTSFVGSTVDNVDDIKRRNIISQEPSMTVYIKKRAFWGLSSVNDSRFMDDGEKLFMRASKILFEKKCNQIAAYEALTKLPKLVSEDAFLDADLIAAIGETAETILSNSYEMLDDDAAAAKATDPSNTRFTSQIDQNSLDEKNRISESVESLLENIDELKRRQGKLNQATNTTWVIDPDVKDIFGVGRGAGVIELTLVSSVNTSLGLEGGGRVNLTVQDPYNLMKVTTDDVEISVSAAKLERDIYNDRNKYGGMVDLKGPSTLLEEARRKEEELRRIRENKIADLFGFSRTAVGESKAPEIIFEISPTSSSTQRVVAYTTLTDVAADSKDNLVLALSQLPVEYQLGFDEADLVGTIFKLLNDYADAVQSLNTEILDNNKEEDVAYARKQMRMHYLGKSIIQPMDSIHVYMRGNTIKHGSLIGPLNAILNNSKFVDIVSKNPDVSDAVIQEEMKQFGMDELGVPIEFYKAMRTGSFMRNAGLHVFGGVVNTVSESYNASNGTYILNVEGSSNLKWLDMSRVNTSPSLAQPKGMLEDPLTPFKLEVDEKTGLIKEEPQLLDVNNRQMVAKMIRDKYGVLDGEAVENKADLEQEYISFENSLRVVWKHAPGIVYKWKPGVSVATYDVNLATSLKGSENDLDILKRYVGLNIVDKPFAGLDAADIVSLLVTGYPHSASRFYDNAKGIGTFTAAGSNASQSYFHSFFDITRTTNATLGNFRPFRAVGLEGRLLARRLHLQTFLTTGYKKIDQLRGELATYRDQLIRVNTRPKALTSLEVLEKKAKEQKNNPNRKRILKNHQKIENQRNLVKEGLESIITNLEERINFELRELAKRTNQAKEDGLITNTDNIVFRLDEIPSGLAKDAQEQSETSIRLKNKILQLRTQYDCKFNTDENLFIVSDQYDNDRDIQAFVRRLRQQQSLFNSQYQHPLRICEEVSKTLDFEFFCDTQGHIQFRPPQYNRVPLSLVIKMFLLNNKNGIQLYPDFMKAMFNSKLDNLKEEQQVIDMEIEIDALSLGLEVENDAAIDFIRNNVETEDITGNVYFRQVGENSFDTGTGDVVTEDEAEGVADAIQKLSNNIQILTGRKSELQDLDKAKEHVLALNDPNNKQVNSQRLQVANRLKSLVGKKQEISTLVDKLESRADKFKEDSPFTNFSKSEVENMLAPYQDLIEDDYNDFLGPGSSKRFIIYDDQIISSNFTESDRNAYCRVDVNGEIDLIGNQPGEIAPGLPTVWAGATDFDMWRMYGYRALPTQNKPFLKDAKDQCAPYALFLLARARRDVVQGSVTLPGNEYYQLGDVVYINSRDTLFYVSDIKHNFSYESGAFTTTLECRYGHTLGEYIPTPLDVIGKQLIRQQEKFNRILISRETAGEVNGVHLGLVVFEDDAAGSVDDERREMLKEPFARFNVTELKRSLLVARNYIISNSKGDFPKVEVRGWVSSDDSSEIDKVKNRMDAVVHWLQHTRGRYMEHSTENRYIVLGDQYNDSKLEDNHISNKIFTGDHAVNPVNLTEDLKGDDKTRGRIPNIEVYNASDTREPYNIIEMVLLLK